ncbi:Sodium/hydrogen exchanger family-domain-containing protein [Dendryphion nanum]|uniref:Sodium/hydrogen exchanger family-domain-containing protein n=1 Tax=Dendryphion nanum TaxID=256645 RepID=A0A9P9IPS8_9PLEO|nr:Sodium/hydrogen exchanger family-domain-containing protein [Dendryphion nanum]
MSSAADVVRTVTQVVTAVASASASATAKANGNKAPPQGGVLEKVNPVHFDPKNPLILFIVQAGIIIIFCRLLHYPLAKIRQPRVIAEVIGGILLGPSVMGRIPGFKASIFPDAGMPTLNLVANLGLTLFLFIVGLEVDLRIAARNWKVALSVGIVGMALPFGMGVAIAVGLYHQFSDEPGTVQVNFGIFALFVGVAMAITAFPVLCRILTELKLLETPVGIIVLAAGVGNDVVGWILLALCVALVNAGSGLTALWVLLTCVGFTIFLVYAVRPAFVYVLRRSGALQDGPSQGIIGLTLLLALASAFFTGIIGVHAIFGAFMAGMICPHEGGFNIKVAEKIEDLICAIFLPLYFTLSGLNTNVGLLDSGIVWAYVIGVCAVAFCAKFIGAASAARFSGMMWRECFAIGSLMSCKGLVELIVLNIGLQAKILGTRTFTIFVVMALVTTFATSPLTIYFYPPWYQKKVEAYRRGEIDWDGKPLDGSDSVSESANIEKLEADKIKRITVYLRLDSMPNLLAFASLFGGKSEKQDTKLHPSIQRRQDDGNDAGEVLVHGNAPKRPVEAHGLRLLNLTDRGSSVMQVYEGESYTTYDPIVNTFRTFGRLHNLAISGEALVVPEASFADTLITRASDSDLLVIPWSETGGMSEQAIIEDKGTKNKLAASSYLSFVTSALDQATVTTAVLVNKNFGGPKNKEKSDRAKLVRTYSSVSLSSHRDAPVTAPIADPTHHIFFPFFGGSDDRAALRLVLQLAENTDVTATILHYEVSEDFLEIESSPETEITTKGPDTVITTNSASRDQDATFFASLRASLPSELSDRVIFESVSSPNPLKDVITRAGKEVGQSPKNAGDLIVLGRNIGRRGLGLTKSDEIGSTTAAAKSLGVLANNIWTAKLGASVLVVKAAR